MPPDPFEAERPHEREVAEQVNEHHRGGAQDQCAKNVPERVTDLGGDGSDPNDDYPDFAQRLALAVRDGDTLVADARLLEDRELHRRLTLGDVPGCEKRRIPYVPAVGRVHHVAVPRQVPRRPLAAPGTRCCGSTSSSSASALIRPLTNVVLGNAFGQNVGVVVDTHVGRQPGQRGSESGRRP